ncbi:MAG: DinB family protein [Phycisphaerales bacterium]|nr:DinB family protein [Phycisphaerales bacterium]
MTTATASNRSTAMSIAHSMLQEFERELPTTRKFLERLPDDRLTWKPHEKSMTAGQLALHIAQSPQGVLNLSLEDEAAPPDFSAGPPQPQTKREVLEALDTGADFVRGVLPTLDDERMRHTFRVVRDGETMLAMPRADFLRAILLNHWYHHRGQLGVYLRLVGAKVPSSYGPSGDEW